MEKPWGSDQVASFPTKIAMKLLWVWLGDGEPRGHPKDILKGAGMGRSFGTVGRIPRWLVVFLRRRPGEDERQPLGVEFEVTGTYTRDLPYGFLVLACLVIHLAFLR